MTISALIIADSISPDGIRLTTMQLRYPRFIHAEELTHRRLEIQPDLFDFGYDLVIPDGVMYDQNLSRNASSSRAVPVERLIEDILSDTAMPIHWGKNQRGMQADDEHNELLQLDHFDPDTGVFKKVSMTAEASWLKARDNAIEIARAFSAAGYHKQIVNRLLEPFSHINVVVTATEWANFFALRRHKDAQPEIKALADAMWDAMQASTPDPLLAGQWHLPYVPHWERADIVKEATGKSWDQLWDEHDYAAMIKVSVARCASVSYKTVDGLPMTIERATALFDKLVTAELIHASPAEHQATPDKMSRGKWKNPQLHGNLRGWKQVRKSLAHENITAIAA